LKKTVADTVIIFKDHTASGGLYLSCFVYLILFAIPFVWLIGTFTEFYRLDQDFVTGVIVLSLFSLLFGWRVVSKILAIISISKEKPLIKVNKEGIAILGDKFRPWTEIKQIRLISDFNTKYIELECFAADESMNYMLYSAADTYEFKHLPELKGILDEFTDKASISEF
jgi:hypothetical protein